MEPASDARQTVLYIEDHIVNIALMEAVFDRRPHLRLVVAADGAQALAVASGLRPVLLMVDLNLPDVHGAQLLQQLRKFPSCRDVPAVAVTAQNDFEYAAAGFVDLWPKPLDLGQLFDRLDRITTAEAAPGAATAASLRPLSRWNAADSARLRWQAHPLPVQ